MVKCTEYKSKEELVKLQKLVKLLDLKTFNFLSVFPMAPLKNENYFIHYECDVQELNKLRSYVYESEIEPKKPWNRIKKFFYKLFN